jgi:IS605 OrfB family transposase
MLIETISCKVVVVEEDIQSFFETRHLFTEACNAVLAKALETRIKNPVKLHQLMYAEIRKRFRLKANLAVRAIRRVAGTLSEKKHRRGKPKQYRPGSIDYDARIFSFREKDHTLSLTTVSGRKRVRLDIGEYQKEALKGQNPSSGTLILKGKEWYFNMTVKREEPLPATGGNMGIDLGLRNTAFTSTGFASSGETRQEFKNKRAKIRASLQSKGTRGAKRKLRKISGYEKRRIRHENHQLSKQIIEEAQRHKTGIIRMEQLKGIRERTRVWNPHRNRMTAGWSFYQLQQFVVYKAKKVGIAVEFVDPAYTSQVCSDCGQLGERNKDLFKCVACGEKHADYNAACNISIGGAVVNRPELTV